MRIEPLDEFHHAGDLSSRHNGKDHLDRAGAALAVHAGNAVIPLSQTLQKGIGALLSDDANQDNAQGKPLDDQNPDVVTRGKTASISHITYRISQILHNLADGQDPYQYLEEARQRGQILESACNKNQANGPQRDVADPRQEDQEWQDQPGVEMRFSYDAGRQL